MAFSPVTYHENNEQGAQWHQMSEEQFACDLNCNNNAAALEGQEADLKGMYENARALIGSMVKKVKGYWSMKTKDDNPAFAFSLAMDMVQTNLMMQYSKARDIKTKTPGDATETKIEDFCRLVAEIEKRLGEFIYYLEDKNKIKAFEYIKHVEDQSLTIDSLYQVSGVREDEDDVGKMYKGAFASLLEMIAGVEKHLKTYDPSEDPAWAFISLAEFMRRYLNRKYISARKTSKYYQEVAKSLMEIMCFLVREVEGEYSQFNKWLENKEKEKALGYTKTLKDRCSKFARGFQY